MTLSPLQPPPQTQTLKEKEKGRKVEEINK